MFERDHEERVKIRAAKDTWPSPDQWERGSCFCREYLWKLRSAMFEGWPEIFTRPGI